MGLFGIVKTAGEAVAAEAKEWMGTDYFKATVITGGTTFLEEVTNAMAVATLNLTKMKATIYKTIHRLVFSAIYYFGFKSLGYKLEALTASVMPVVLSIVDGISYLLRQRQKNWALGRAAHSG